MKHKGATSLSEKAADWLFPQNVALKRSKKVRTLGAGGDSLKNYFLEWKVA